MSEAKWFVVRRHKYSEIFATLANQMVRLKFFGGTCTEMLSSDPFFLLEGEVGLGLRRV